MEIPGRLLILLITLHQAVFTLAVTRHKGKLYGDSCIKFDDCGDWSSAFMLCQNNICQCPFTSMLRLYYQEEDKMCVAYVGDKCDVSESKHGVSPLVCGKNSECVPVRHDRLFGRCQCSPGHVQNFDQKCEPVRSHVNSNAIPMVDRPSHPKPSFPTGNQNYGLETAERQRQQHHNPNLQSNNYNQNSNTDENGQTIVAFPFPSPHANTKSGVNSAHSSLTFNHCQHSYTVVLAIFLTFSITRYFLLF